MIKEAILKLSNKEDLSFDLAFDVMNEIMQGNASDIQISSYLTALAIKGETINEITGSAKSMKDHCVKFSHNMDVLEIVGTGGDKSNSFNISTTAALVIASCGVPIAKHGNRASSSKSGSADVLEALGVNIMITPEQSEKMLKDINICFLFAQNYHLAVKHVAHIRKELGIRTVFNLIGPLSSPANAKAQIMGVYEEALIEPLAKVMHNLGVKRGMTVFGQDKLDEISISAPTTVCEVEDGKYKIYTIKPEDFGYKTCDKSSLVGGDAVQNAQITKAILQGEKSPRRDVVCLNAGAGLFVAGNAKSLKDGVLLAEKLIDDGSAYKKLQDFIKYSNEV